MSASCRPFWVTRFDALNQDEVRKKNVIRLEGCGLNVNPESPDYGWVLCSPENLRANAEQKMIALGHWPADRPLTLDIYSLARNIATEQGSSTVEMKVCLGLSTWGQAARGVRGNTVTEVILRNTWCPGGNSGPRCYYGRIHGKEGTSSAPFGRWTASSRDPSVVDLLIADFVLSGGAGQPLDPQNFARGASNQATSYAINVTEKSKYREYWVGPIPNVNPKALMLTAIDKTIAADSPEGLARIRAAKEMQVGPEPDWRAEGGICSPDWLPVRPITPAQKIATVAMAAAVPMLMGVAAHFITRPTPRLVATRGRRQG